MKASDAIREILFESGVTQAQLAKQIGLKGHSSVSSRLSRGQMNMNTFMLMLESCGYELVIRPVDSSHRFVDGEILIDREK